MQTQLFGEIEYEQNQVITFPYGLPGFPEDTHFLLIPESDTSDLFFWLQSVDNGDVAFTLIDVYKVIADYNPTVEPDELTELGDWAEKPLEIYNIVVIPEDAKEMRVNLKAPVVINMDTGLGKQVIVNNDEYLIRYMIFDELQKLNQTDRDGH